jgi:hypothetical protein
MRALNNSKNYNLQRPLKSLKFKTSWALIRQCYNDDKQSFRENQKHKTQDCRAKHIHNLTPFLTLKIGFSVCLTGFKLSAPYRENQKETK